MKADYNATVMNSKLGSWDWAGSRKVALSVAEKRPAPGKDDEKASGSQEEEDDAVLIHVRIFTLPRAWVAHIT